MTDKIIETVLHWLEAIFVRRELVVTFIAILPIVEARMAIPIAFGYKLGVFQSWLFSFIGSSLMAPLLLLILIPLIKWLSNTRVFRKLGQTLYDKFESKAKTVKTDESETNAKKREFKKALGVFVFVAIPLPLTGVWTGSAVASILKLRYPRRSCRRRCRKRGRERNNSSFVRLLRRVREYHYSRARGNRADRRDRIYRQSYSSQKPCRNSYRKRKRKQTRITKPYSCK